MKDISTTLRASGKLRWDTLGGDEAVFVDKIPTTDKQTPYDLGRNLPDHERENLLAIAPGIVLRDVL